MVITIFVGKFHQSEQLVGFIRRMRGAIVYKNELVCSRTYADVKKSIAYNVLQGLCNAPPNSSEPGERNR